MKHLGFADDRRRHSLTPIFAAGLLACLGAGMECHNRSIYGCTEAPAEFNAPTNALLTYHPEARRLYVHLLAYPMTPPVLPKMAGKVKYMQFLHDASEIQFKQEQDDLLLQLPELKPPAEIPVLELFLK